MHRCIFRLLFTGVILAALIAVPLTRPHFASSQQVPIIISGPTGHIGLYTLDADPVDCKYFSSGSLSGINPDGPIRVKAYQNHSVPTQKVGSTIRLYQRLANGSYQFRSEAFAGSVTASKTTDSNLGAGAITNVITGPDWILAHKITWYKTDNVTADGSIIVAYPSYQRIKNNVNDGAPTSVCGSPYLPPNVWLEHHPSNTYTSTVNSHVEYELHKFAIGVTVNVRFNGTQIDSVVTNADAEGIGDFIVPAVQKGTYPIEFKYGHWVATGTVTVKPRIKIIPSEDIARDQTVNVSLRGFAKNEVVRIRWKKGSGWYQVAQVTTSSTGSANVNVKVPKFVPNGSTSVRGDGNKGAAAQTNAVTVFGGPFSSSTVKSLPPAPTPDATNTATVAPTQTSEASPSFEPTTPPSTPEASPTVTPTDTPAGQTPSPEPTETATLELTAEPTATVELTSTPVVDETQMPES